MAIKRKDGTVYKLQGPNPIMENQSLWTDGSILHNFNIIEVVTKELEDIEVEEIIVPIKETIEPPKNKERIVPKEVPREVVHCLPAEIKESYDPLYDENRSSLVYGKKFTVEVIFMSRNDLVISIWNNSAELKKNSIVYIPKDKRWWMVTDSMAQNNGYTSTCVPSSVQPSFD